MGETSKRRKSALGRVPLGSCAAPIENNQPRLVVCGYVHNSNGMDYVGRTFVINTACSATLITIGGTGAIEAEIIG